MIVLLDTSHGLAECGDELGCNVGQLLTPLTRFKLRPETTVFAIDNGAYSHFERKAFESLVAANRENSELCKFVACPDVVGDARRTLECFDLWQPKLHGWPVALVIQDGQEALPIPWNRLQAIFIGGSTDFKMSPAVRAIIKTAQIFEKWVHVGRVNTPERFSYFEQLGADSCDGSGISRFTEMRLAIKNRNQSPQIPLFETERFD